MRARFFGIRAPAASRPGPDGRIVDSQAEVAFPELSDHPKYELEEGVTGPNTPRHVAATQRVLQSKQATEVMTAEDVIMFLRISPSTLGRLLKSNRLQCYRLSEKGRRYFKRRDVERLVSVVEDHASALTSFIRAQVKGFR